MPERHPFWRIFATAYTLLAVTVYVARIYSSGLDYLDPFVSAPSIFALWGFAYRFPIWNPWFWRVYAPLIVGWDVYFQLSYFPIEELVDNWQKVAIGNLITLPVYIVVFRYAWEKFPEPAERPSEPENEE